MDSPADVAALLRMIGSHIEEGKQPAREGIDGYSVWAGKATVYLEQLYDATLCLSTENASLVERVKVAEAKYCFVRDSWDGVAADGTRLISYSVGPGIGQGFADKFDAAIDAAIGRDGAERDALLVQPVPDQE